jgi:hypothetical protein
MKEEVDYSSFEDPEVKHTVLLNYQIRAIIELANTQPGITQVKDRINRVLGISNAYVHTHSVKRLGNNGNVYAAKASSVADIDIKSLIKSCKNIKLHEGNQDKGLLIQPVRITLPDYQQVVSIYTVKLYYSTETFVADIDIIPAIGTNISKNYLIANLESITEMMSDASKTLCNFVGMCVDEFKASPNTLKHIIEIVDKDITKQGLVKKANLRNFEELYADNANVISIFNTYLKGDLLTN